MLSCLFKAGIQRSVDPELEKARMAHEKEMERQKMSLGKRNLRPRSCRLNSERKN